MENYQINKKKEKKNRQHIQKRQLTEKKSRRQFWKNVGHLSVTRKMQIVQLLLRATWTELETLKMHIPYNMAIPFLYMNTV